MKDRIELRAAIQKAQGELGSKASGIRTQLNVLSWLEAFNNDGNEDGLLDGDIVLTPVKDDPYMEWKASLVIKGVSNSFEGFGARPGIALDNLIHSVKVFAGLIAVATNPGGE